MEKWDREAHSQHKGQYMPRQEGALELGVSRELTAIL